jgi:hypothetical protein
MFLVECIKNLLEDIFMDYKKAKRANIIVSILFALAMIISSYFIADKEVSKTVVLMLIAAWLVPFFYLTKQMKRK